MTERQLAELLMGMSLEEKALQLTQYPAYLSTCVVTGGDTAGDLSLSELRRMGSILNANDGAEIMELRRDKREHGIPDPLLVMHDVIHGYRTIAPVPLALACSFNLQLVQDCAEMAATEAKYDGVDVTFSPMADLVRDARWGRVMESAGEDPYLCGEVGKAFIRGYHAGGLACCIKHFAAYGAAESGKEYNTAELSEHTLHEYYLRGYAECLKENPELVMTAFCVLNGVPATGNRRLTVDILRDEWGFDGVLISDYASVREMICHGYCPDEKLAAYAAMKAKLDIEMSSPCYARYLPELVKEGKISEDEIDDAVMRVLKLKNRLGLYENPERETNLKKRDEVTLCGRYRMLVRRAAEESCVLLKNDGVLPLKESASVVFVGPFAAEKEIFGNWGCRGNAEDTVSVKEGVEALLKKSVKTAPGCSHKLKETDESMISEAVQAAAKSEVIVACVGESMWNSGEAHSRTDIRIPKVQRKLINELSKLQKPLVLVVFGGRPQVLTEIEEHADAVLYVWQPGTEGGNAIAGLLYGKVNPSGKTAMSFPRASGQCPVYYNSLNTGRPNTQEANIYLSGYDDLPNTPLYPFGFGLSYTKFEFSDLRLSDEEFGCGGNLMATVRVKNAGAADGQEVVQWYIRDLYASCVRPVKELKGFEKITLKAGEEKIISFEITEKTLAFQTAEGKERAEAGEFVLYVGGNSRDCLQKKFILK